MADKDVVSQVPVFKIIREINDHGDKVLALYVEESIFKKDSQLWKRVVEKLVNGEEEKDEEQARGHLIQIIRNITDNIGWHGSKEYWYNIATRRISCPIN